jgi:class 3 adenylate cyclase
MDNNLIEVHKMTLAKKPSSKKTKRISQKGRQLSVIMAADVAEYSRLMAENESRTLALLERARRKIDAQIKAYGGRIANTAGDSIVAVFGGATDALECSIEIQKFLTRANKNYPDNKKLLFRIGLHMGETFSRGKDILGAGVNIAARLEGSTEPGAICMSEAFFSVADQSVIDMPVADRGKLALKNIATPIQAYEIMSARAQSRSVEFRHKKQLNAQYRRLIIFGSAIGVVLFAALFSWSVAYNLTKVSRIDETVSERQAQPAPGYPVPVLPQGGYP